MISSSLRRPPPWSGGETRRPSARTRMRWAILESGIVRRMPLNLSTLGGGFPGAVHAVCLANLGQNACGTGIEHKSTNSLHCGRSPFYEPALDELRAYTLTPIRLSFPHTHAETKHASACLVCAGNPQRLDSNVADESAGRLHVDIGRSARSTTAMEG